MYIERERCAYAYSSVRQVLPPGGGRVGAHLGHVGQALRQLGSVFIISNRKVSN